MSPHIDLRTNRPTPRRPIHLLLLRLGVAGVFLVASAVSLMSFSLFGCYCWNPYGELPKLQPIDDKTPPPPPENVPAT